ncbi:MAG: TetR/AcrR family transcriptional regulator [Verrucomicrobiota bacterium]
MTTSLTQDPSFLVRSDRTVDVYQAAAELMVQKGFGGTSIADIAKAVGMTKAGLYHHISSKQDMLYQIMHHAMDLLDQIVITPAKDVPDPEERLRKIIRLHIQTILERGQAFTILFSEKHHLAPEQLETIRSRVNDYRKLIKGSLLELSQQGRLRQLDPDVATKHIIQTVIGIAHWDHQGERRNAVHLIDETIEYNLSAVLKS